MKINTLKMKQWSLKELTTKSVIRIAVLFKKQTNINNSTKHYFSYIKVWDYVYTHDLTRMLHLGVLLH